MSLENNTLWGLIVAGSLALGPVIKEMVKYFLANKIKHSQELDSVRVLEEKSKLKERDETLEFLKTYLEKKDKDFELLKEILYEVKTAVQENQFTDERDFQCIVYTKIELLFLKFQFNIEGILERNHITSVTKETTFRKINNLVDRELNTIVSEINLVHFHTSVKQQVVNVINLKREDIKILFRDVIEEYVEQENNIDVIARKQSACVDLQIAVNHGTISYNTLLQQIFTK